MSILLHTKDFWNSLNKNNSAIPLILVGDATCLYYLVTDIHEELERFITTGRTNTKEFHALPNELEQLLISHCEQLDYVITQHSQQVKYMHREVSITYLKVRNPETGLSISLLPWFLLPDRPYPVFIYIYAIWHYHNSDKKSLSQTTAAVRKLFGIGRLNKSTISRSIKALENIIDTSRINRPLTIDNPTLPSSEEVIKLVLEILSNAPSIESLEERYQEMVKYLPPPINRIDSVRCALSGIPLQYIKVIKGEEVVRAKPRDIRKRPGQSRRKELKRVQHPLNFVDFQQLEQTRRAFIEICRCIVLDAAISYHQFLV